MRKKYYITQRNTKQLTKEQTKEEIVVDSYTWCITSYPWPIQDYNTMIFIGSARRRAEAQTRQSFTQHIREQ
ncbi:unnamed protein product [Adineta ricciae]|uniref:Uncharacterized protein n=1 Tax=Adineta ricciae TaxID=249248 RepID=A0A815V5A8_ADIRI|nr:unnamed protein product [Adineta ricciae]